MVGRPKKVINRLVEKWEHEFLLKVMARKIQRAKPTLAGKTGASPKPAQSAPASVSPSRRPSFQQAATSPPEQDVANPRAATCHNGKKKAQPGAPLIAELERAAVGSKEKQATSAIGAQVKPPWKGPMDDVITDFGCAFEFDELPAGPRQQRRQTLGGVERSDNWEPLPRPNRPSAVPQKTPVIIKKGLKKEDRKPVLLVIPVEQAGPIKHKPRLSRKSESAPSNQEDVSKQGVDARQPRGNEDVSKQDGQQKGVVRKERTPLEPRADLGNLVLPPKKEPILKKTNAARKEALQSTPIKERNGPRTENVKSGKMFAAETAQQDASSQQLPKDKKDTLECSNEGPPLRVDVSPRQQGAMRRMTSSNIPRPRGTPGEALRHRARHSLRPVEGCSDWKEEQISARLPSRGRYEDTREENFPVHQADSGEFFIRTPSSGIDQPFTASEESALARQAGREPAIVMPGSGLEGMEIGSALQQEIFGLNCSLEAMKETLRGVNERAKGLRKGLRVSAKSDVSNASSQGSASEEDDTCRTGESDDERDQDNKRSDNREELQTDELSLSSNKEEDIDAQIAQQENLQQALLREIATAETDAALSLEEHQRDFLSESRGEWAPITGEESRVDASAACHVSKDEDEYKDDFEGALIEGDELHTAEDTLDVEGEELVPNNTKTSPNVGFLARLSYQVDGVRGSREESLPGSPDRILAGGFAQLTARGTRKVPVDMEGLTAEIEKLEQEMQRLKR